MRKSRAVAAEDAALLETIENSSDTSSQYKPAHEIEKERINAHIVPNNAAVLAVDGLSEAPARVMATIEAEQPAAPHIRSGRRPTLSTIKRPAGRSPCKYICEDGRGRLSESTAFPCMIQDGAQVLEEPSVAACF